MFPCPLPVVVLSLLVASLSSLLLLLLLLVLLVVVVLLLVSLPLLVSLASLVFASLLSLLLRSPSFQDLFDLISLISTDLFYLNPSTTHPVQVDRGGVLEGW